MPDGYAWHSVENIANQVFLTKLESCFGAVEKDQAYYKGPCCVNFDNQQSEQH